MQRDTRFASSESTQGYRLQIFGAFTDAHHACTRAWVLQRFSNIQRSPAHHCFTALTVAPPRVENRARLGVCIRCGCDRFFGTRAREATGINPLHRRRHPATVGRPASGRPGSRPYRRRSRTTTFGQKLVTFVSRATASSRRRCPRGLEARRAAGAPSQALRGGGTGLGLVMGYANARGTPPRRSPAAWRLPVSGRTVHGSQLAVRGRFWAVGAQFLPPTRASLTGDARPCRLYMVGSR